MAGYSKPPPDRGSDPKRKPQPLNTVRGGGICDPNEKGAHVMKGSYKAAVCMPTPGPDPRPRWRQAGRIGAASRHSQHYMQHRSGGKPYGKS